jgi:hypothetical protein
METGSHDHSDSEGYSTELGSTRSSQNNKDDDEDRSHKELAQQETRALQRLRLVFALVLLVCTVVVAVCVYLYVSGTEQAAFEEAYNTDATKVLEAIGKFCTAYIMIRSIW